MNTKIANEIIEEGIKTLYAKLGSTKTLKFFQLIGINRGDSVKELEEKTKNLSKDEVISLIKHAQKLRSSLWKKVHLI